jgi:hypothetical protein
MTARALRVGLLLGGNLVEERLFRGHAPITFGQSLRCALSVPGDGIPAEHALFVHDQGHLLLRVPATALGRLAQGGTIRTDLREGETIALDRGARGKLTIGDATVLFQEIAAPPIAPRPQLPASVRGTLADRIDRRLAVIIGASLLAHLGIGAWAWIRDRDTTSMLETPVAAMYHQETMEVSLPEVPEPVTVPATDPVPGVGAPATRTQTPAPIVTPTRVHTHTTDPQRMLDDAERMAQILTGSDPSGNGFGEMSKRQPGADLDKQLADVRDGNRKVTLGDNGHGFREQPGLHVGDGHGPDLDDPTLVASSTHRGDAPTGRIVVKPLPGEGPGTTLTVDAVLAKINGVYMSGLVRCYKKGLVHDGTLGGKVAISFTVNDQGGLEDAGAHGVSSDVDACISTLMSSWRFTIPRDKDGDTTEASFKLALALQPS